jgi:hypothetical protein
MKNNGCKVISLILAIMLLMVMASACGKDADIKTTMSASDAATLESAGEKESEGEEDDGDYIDFHDIGEESLMLRFG